MLDPRFVQCDGEPECDENFARIGAFLDGKAPACEETTAGTYTLSATVDSEGKVTYEWVAAEG